MALSMTITTVVARVLRARIEWLVMGLAKSIRFDLSMLSCYLELVELLGVGLVQPWPRPSNATLPAFIRSEILVTRTDALLKMLLFLVKAPCVSVMLIHSQRRERRKIAAGCLADLKHSD